MIRQREVVEIPFNLTQGVEFHPAIVLSVDEANEQEGSFVAVMMTGADVNDQFSFDLSDSMFTKPLDKKCQVRLHLISYFREKDVTTRRGAFMKAQYFTHLLRQINEITFEFDR